MPVTWRTDIQYVQFAHDTRQHIVREPYLKGSRTLCGRDALAGWIGGGTFRENLPNLCPKCMAVLRQPSLLEVTP